MNRNGFTLAEALVTIAIIGVLAALTIPPLVTNNRNQAYASKLSVVASNVENAFTSAIIKENAGDLYGTSLWENAPINGNSGDNIKTFVGNLGQYLITSGYENSETVFYSSVPGFYPMKDNGSKNTEKVSNTFDRSNPYVAILTKNGATVFINTNAEPAGFDSLKEQAIKVGSSYYSTAGNVIIDVNGLDQPNTFGRDIFFFQLGENGILYPKGGKDVSTMDGSGDWDAANQIATCLDNSKGSNDELKGVGCTARVIQEGYKMNY